MSVSSVHSSRTLVLYTLFLISYETYTGKKVDLGEIGNKKFEMSIRHLNVTNEILH